MKFECVVPGAGIKSKLSLTIEFNGCLYFSVFARAVHCLAKIGEEMFLEVHQDFVSHVHHAHSPPITFCRCL